MQKVGMNEYLEGLGLWFSKNGLNLVSIYSAGPQGPQYMKTIILEEKK